MARSAAQIQIVLDAYYAAQLGLATHQSYSLDTGQGRQTVTRADLPSINATIAQLEAEIEQLTSGGIMFLGLGRNG
jgi:hypothetical protein